MPFSESVKVMLYARSGNRCAFPGCKTQLVFTLKEYRTIVNHGKAAHIVAESPNGPRGKTSMSLAKRNSYENGIVLCTNHHDDIIDKYPDKFTVNQLRKWKKRHEDTYGKVSSSSAQNIEILRRYAEYVDKWTELAAVKGWMSWTAPLLRAGSNCMSQEVYRSYLEMCSWLATRVWPGIFKSFEDALNNFGRVAADFIFTFDRHSEAHGNMLCTDKFYRQVEPRTPQREKAVADFQFHTALVEDLVLELTRAGNLVCQRVRESIDAQFRQDEGHLMVESGMYEGMEFRRHVLQYRPAELKKYPYPGLAEFMSVRDKRDLHFGTGVRRSYVRTN
jgi:hypothetical protein